MPQRKQPKSLFDLSIVEAAQAILKICVKIELKYGDYNEPATRAQVKRLQRRLMEMMPAALMDKLYERRLQSLEYELRDHKILLSVYLHRNLRSLSCLTTSLRSINSDNYWLEKLRTLNNLTALDFKLMCTDEILQVIGDNCPKLEYINCISKMSTMNRSSPSNLNFNALRVELFVSDEGLGHLAKCKRLKKISMNRKINSQCAGRKPTIDGIRALVKSLPVLQCLTFEDLGSVISTGMEDCGRLSLIQVSDIHPTPQHMLEIARLCPDLKDLFLVRPIYSDESLSPMGETPLHEDIVNALTQTDLKLELLGLEHFAFDDSFVSYLIVKGETLTSLQLISRYDQITSQEVLLVGECCPNVVGLHLHGLTAEKKYRYRYPKRSRKLFPKLNCLSLGGNNWDPCVILPMCIVSAPDLGRMSLLNKGCEITLDNVFSEMILVHKFEKLKVVNLYEGCFITFETLQSFIHHCPSLIVMKVKPKGFTREDVDVLIKDLYANNFEIIIEVMAVP